MEAIELIKHRGSRELLQTLLKFPRRQFTINELSKEARVPFASAWRLVKMWEQAGMIETGRLGRSVAVRLRSSPYLKSIARMLETSMSPQAFTARYLKQVLANEKGVMGAYLFGSVASKKEGLGSDVDVALVARKEFDANGLVYRVYERHGTKIVPLVFGSKAELEAFLKGKKAERLK